MEGRPLDEKELITRARSGDLGAFEDLVRTYQSSALRLAYLLVRDHGEAEDLTQDAFVKAYRAMSKFREDAPFRPWLLTIVRNEASNRRRSSGRRTGLVDRVVAEPTSGDAAPSPETVAMRNEDAKEVLAAVDLLPERQRVVVACRYLLGLSEDETAEVLGIAVGTVKSRASRALDRLRPQLESSRG